MSKQPITLDIFVPDDYEVIGYKRLEKGDLYYARSSVCVWTADQPSYFRTAIVAPKQVWRDAIIEDAVVCIHKGPRAARFRMNTNADWVDGELTGALRYDDGQVRFLNHNNHVYKFAQILVRPPIPPSDSQSLNDG